MATVRLLQDDKLFPEMRAAFGDTRGTRGSDLVTDVWRALAHDPATLRRTWEPLTAVMAPGALDPETREAPHVAVPVAHGCGSRVRSHTAATRARGVTAAEHVEMLAVVGMAARTNRLVTGLGVAVDVAFLAGEEWGRAARRRADP